MNAQSHIDHQPPTPQPVIRAFDADALLAGQTTVQIVLDEQVYVLRKTRAGKLILTK